LEAIGKPPGRLMDVDVPGIDLKHIPRLQKQNNLRALGG
jgi:hypothetical protein